MSSQNSFSVYVKSVIHEAHDILSYEFLPLPEAGAELPPFAAGAHIDLIIEGAPLRSYSLLNSQSDKNRYVIAVAKDPKSRGGSRLIHEKLHCGDQIKVSAPKNCFELYEGGGKAILLAGGIGITPIWSMAQRLENLAINWELHYFARGRESAALLDRLESSFKYGEVHLHFAQSVDETVSTISSLLSAGDDDTHFYCCGPSGMLNSYLEASKAVPSVRVHYESFVPLQEASTGGGFEVHLARSGKTVSVVEGQSVLDALGQAGVEVMNSCREGICGACEVQVLEGQPDHRDSILSEYERSSNKTMFVCCSGSKSPRLVLDL